MPKVRDIMTTSVRSVPPDMTFADLERLLAAERIGGAPVVDAGRLVGVISRADVVRRLGQEQAQADLALAFYQSPWEDPFSSVQLLSKQSAAVAERMVHLCVKDAMTRRVIAVLPDDPVEVAAKAMAEHGIHRVLVREGDAIAGIVTSLDVVRLVAQRGLGS